MTNKDYTSNTCSQLVINKGEQMIALTFEKRAKTILKQILQQPENGFKVAHDFVMEYYNFMQVFDEEAFNYINERNAINNSKKSVIDAELKNVKNLFPSYETIHMSSYILGIDMQADSDIDFGMFVSELTEDKITKIQEQLQSHGYSLKGIFNENCEHFKYYSFEKDEYEVKVMDTEKSLLVKQLFDYMKQKFEETPNYQSRFTHLKHLLYTHTYSKDKKRRNGYDYFKFLLYTAFFHEIGSGFYFTWMTLECTE